MKHIFSDFSFSHLHYHHFEAFGRIRSQVVTLLIRVLRGIAFGIARCLVLYGIAFGKM